MRGRNYLTDRKKIAADAPMFELAAVDHVELDAPTFHIARHLPSLKCATRRRSPAVMPLDTRLRACYNRVITVPACLLAPTSSHTQKTPVSH